jgi:small subunit ribosomal protein S16
VAADSEAPRDGRFLEILGSYDPRKEPAVVKIHENKLQYWIDKGAKLTEATRALVKREGAMKSHSAAT